MLTENNLAQKIMLILLKDLSSSHTVTSLAKELHITRVGAWKTLKKLEKDELIMLDQIGNSRTSIYTIKLNWNNIITKKTLVLYLAQESLKYKKWQFNFSNLEAQVDFLILYGSILNSPKEAKDIDILDMANKRNLNEINNIIIKIQKTQSKKIHSINLTQKEFKEELKKPNKAFIDAIRQGIILFGQEKFINFIRSLNS
ncbi:HTH domain-containing protein [Candidatus Pacearchaeota archaeon]|nr:HTH domain-containing protein [Candidatus Pacearchaeota archaeon]